MANQYVMAFDLGTSSIKVAIVDAEANIVVSGKRPILPKYPKKGWAESDPEVWWKEGCILSRELVKESGIDPADIVGVGRVDPGDQRERGPVSLYDLARCAGRRSPGRVQ